MELSILIFPGVTLGLLGVFLALPRLARRYRGRVRKRLVAEFHAQRPHDTPRPLFKNLDVGSLSLHEEYTLLREGANPSPRLSWPGFRKKLEQQLLEAGVPLRRDHFLLLALAGAVGLAVGGAVLLGWLGAAAGCLAGAAAPFVCLQVKRRMQRDKFLKQLPGAFELMARVIRSGQSVPQAFQAVGETLDDPLASEFTRYQHQQNLGLSPEVVFQEMANRSSILEFRIFVLALLIQRQTGGNLSDVLERLAALVRQRLHLRQQVRMLTAEGRLQGLTLAVLPFIMFAAMFFLNRKYAEALFDHVPLLWATAALMGIGIVWIRKIVTSIG